MQWYTDVGCGTGEDPSALAFSEKTGKETRRVGSRVQNQPIPPSCYLCQNIVSRNTPCCARNCGSHGG